MVIFIFIFEFRGKHHNESESDSPADVTEIADKEGLLKTKNLFSINKEFHKNCHYKDSNGPTKEACQKLQAYEFPVDEEGFRAWIVGSVLVIVVENNSQVDEHEWLTKIPDCVEGNSSDDLALDREVVPGIPCHDYACRQQRYDSWILYSISNKVGNEPND